MATDEAAESVQSQGLEIAELAETQLVWGFGTPHVLKCTGKGGEDTDRIYSYLAAFELYPPPDRSLPFGMDLHEQWKSAGWRIAAYKEIPDGLVLLTTNPSNDLQVRLDVFGDGRILLNISTPCYEQPDGPAPFGAQYYSGAQEGEPVPSPAPAES
ncbi:hypothetical protein AB0I28_29780 [Phytomonospora sp. NPDC050363]|uniref:hypothetical protein n=1 Tax=Phytomonospora sp. NPDC050363 TaxID=3155642 RepID=UPI0033E912A3